MASRFVPRFPFYVLLAILQAPQDRCGADEAQSTAERPLVFRVIDSQGQPLGGVEVGINAHYGVTGNKRLIAGHDGWSFLARDESDDEGKVTLSRQYASVGDVVVARDPARGLIGYAFVPSADRANFEDGEEGEDLTVIRLQPECWARGELRSADFLKKDQPLPRCSVTLWRDGHELADYFTRDGKFAFPVAAGNVTLKVSGNRIRDQQLDLQVSSSTASEKIRLEVQARRSVMLEGQMAPAITDVLAWKNPPALQPEDCRGKYVLLDFWGYWCDPCLREMPQLIALHEQLQEHGLVIIGVHVSPRGVDHVDTVAALDAKLTGIREQLWGGSDIPFPVALVRARDVQKDDSGEATRSETAWAYGVVSYPTSILIDPAGRVVGEFSADSAGDRQRLRELVMGLQANTGSSERSCEVGDRLRK